jgi:hypothetical protein
MVNFIDVMMNLTRAFFYDDDPTEVRDPNLQPLPNHNILDYPQENGRYLSTKCYVRTDKMRLDRFMELANIASTDLGDHTIVFSELYEIYSYF